MKRELRNLFLLLAGFLLLNGLTLSRYPSVWVDEVEFADPAVSFASGQGFTSTAWFAQDATQFFAGNVPLYPGLLAGWLKIFGTGIIAERSLNLVLFTLVVLLLWRWMRTSGTVTSPAWRLTAVALLLSGHAMVFSYRSGRYDVTGMLLGALILNFWARPVWLLFLGALLPAAGLQLIPAALVLCTIAVFFLGRKALRGALSVVGGMALGALALRLFYGFFGVWDRFRSSTSAIGAASQTFAQKIAGLPAVYTLDKSRILVVIALLIALGLSRKKLSHQTRMIAGFALVTLVLLPASLQLAGKFPIYYGWMVFIPLIIAMAQIGQDLRQGRMVCAVLLVLAALVGLPLRLVSAASRFSERSPSRVREFVRSTVPPGSVVLSDFKAYYALRAIGIRPLLPTYLPALRPEGREAVDLLMLRPEDALIAEKELGGEWRATGEVLFAPGTPQFLKGVVAEMRAESYPLAVYRRVPVEAAAVARN